MTKLNKIAVVLPSKTGASEEKALAKCFDAMLEAQKGVEALLEAVSKLKPLAAATEAEVKKRQVIARGRAAELKDMAKDRTRGQLHSNPSKMARVYKDLNEDVAQANWLEGGAAKALDEEFDKEVAKLTVRIAGGLPKGVTPQLFGFGAMVKGFRDKNAKEKWAKWDANVVAFEAEVERQASNAQREQGIRALMSDAAYSNLFFKYKQKAIDAGIASSTATAQSVRQVLDALLLRQRSPAKAQWAAYLGLGAGGDYKLKTGGTFEGIKYHLRMSKESWTDDADGKVSVATNSVDQIFKKLLSGTADWKQLHATLEVTRNSDNYTHVYLISGVLSNDRKWDAAAILLGKDDDWVERAQAALTEALSRVEKEIKAKIAKAKAVDGQCVM